MLYLINHKKYIEKTPSQLWDEDHKTFYLWIISFIVGLSIIVGIYISAIVLFVLDRDRIIQKFTEISSNSSNNPTHSSNIAYNGFLGQEIMKLAIIFSALVTLVISFVKGIKAKSFAVISFWPTFLMFILTFYSFISLIFLPINGINITASFNTSPSFIIFFSLNFAYLLVYFISSRNVALIRSIFLKVQFIEATKNANLFSNGTFDASSSVGNGPFEQMHDARVHTEHSKQAMEEDVTFKRLNALNKKQLDSIAKQLSISGYETMDKKELLKIIYSIYKSVENDNKTYEVNPENEIDKMEPNTKHQEEDENDLNPSK